MPTVTRVLSATPERATAPKKNGWYAAAPTAITQIAGRRHSPGRLRQRPPTNGMIATSASAPTDRRRKPIDAADGPSAAAVPAVPNRAPAARTRTTCRPLVGSVTRRSCRIAACRGASGG
jgi:hypothetical protein